MYKLIAKELRKVSTNERASNLSRFFKTGKGQYGEGDLFIGVTVPEIRVVAKKFKQSSFQDVQNLLNSKFHEERLCGFEILRFQYASGDMATKKFVYNFVMKNIVHMNNWDLVDLTAPYIIGPYLLDKDRSILYTLAKSKVLWERRVAIISTFAFIRQKDFADSLKLAELLLHDTHDLMHKAVGWMLREVGKRDVAVLKSFLDAHTTTMPRTMLRYAIEKFDEKTRKAYLSKEP